MEKKINIAELLKDCPKGMELDCTMFESIEFDSIVDNENFPIRCRIKNSNDEYNFYNFTKYGYWNNDYKAKCVIFPKGKTTWEWFHRPIKDGDIVFYNDTIAIFKEWGDETLFRTYVTKYLCCAGSIDVKVPLFGKSIRREARLATEEEKQKLFDKLAKEGYKWDAEKKELVKLKWKPKCEEEYFTPVFTHTDTFHAALCIWEDLPFDTNIYNKKWCFKTKEECQAFCDRLNDAINSVKL